MWDDIAEDAFLIRVAAPDAVRCRVVRHFFQTLENLVAINGGILLLGHIEAEHTDILRAEDIRVFHALLEALEMGSEIVLYTDLAERGTDGRNADAVFIEDLLYVFCLLRRKIGNIALVESSGLDVREAVCFQRLDLIQYTAARFIGERGKKK